MLRAIKQGYKSNTRDNSRSFEKRSSPRFGKVAIILRWKYTVELVVFPRTSFEFHLEVYALTSNNPNFEFIPRFANSVEKTRFLRQNL
jgi:hypothetical protein